MTVHCASRILLYVSEALRQACQDNDLNFLWPFKLRANLADSHGAHSGLWWGFILLILFFVLHSCFATFTCALCAVCFSSPLSYFSLLLLSRFHLKSMLLSQLLDIVAALYPFVVVVVIAPTSCFLSFKFWTDSMCSFVVVLYLSSNSLGSRAACS